MSELGTGRAFGGHCRTSGGHLASFRRIQLEGGLDVGTMEISALGRYFVSLLLEETPGQPYQPSEITGWPVCYFISLLPNATLCQPVTWAESLLA